MFNDGDSDCNTQSQTGYYGPIQNPGTDRTTKYAQTSGWKNDISIWNLGRDNIMEELAVKYPGYFWEKNSGYGTKQHLLALDKLGITPIHRKSFAPIYNMLN